MKKRLHTHRYALILMLMALAACHSRVDRGKSPAGLTEFINGADLSYVNQVEEPAWITSRLRDQWGQGSSWDNCTLFDSKGNALPVLTRASPLFIP